MNWARLFQLWKNGWRALFLAVSLVVIGHLVERVALSGVPEQYRHYSMALLFVTIGPFIGYAVARYFFTDPKDEDSEGVKWYEFSRRK